jgi:hypothetical protein
MGTNHSIAGPIPMKKLASTLLLLALGAVPARAQRAAPELPALSLPASTRALALGGIYAPAGAVESDALFYNPALLTAARGLGLSAARYGGASTAGAFSAAQPLAPGGIAIGVLYLDYGVQEAGGVRLAGQGDALLARGPVLASNLVAAVGYGRTVKGVRLGVAGKLIEERQGGARGTGGAVDLGAAVPFLGTTLSLAVQNLGPEFERDGARSPLPRRVTLSAARPSLPVGPFDLVPTAGVAVERDGFVSPAGGAELSYWPVQGKTFVGRFGLRRTPEGSGSPLTLGGGFIGDRFALDYTYERFGAAGAAHRVGVRWRS